ncbi:hypothetical protein ACOSQ3_008784 [Xanthoceras sorbifolium]
MNCSSLDQVSVLPTVPNYMNYSSLHQVSGMPHLNCHSLSAVPQSRFYPFRQTSTLMHQVIPVHPNPSFESYAHRNSVDQNPFAVIANTGSSILSSQSSASTLTSQSSENHVKAEPASSQPTTSPSQLTRQSAGSHMNNEHV